MSEDSIRDMTLQLQFRLFRLKLSFRKLYDFDLSEVVDVYDFIRWLFYCRHKSFENLNSPKFQLVKSRKLSDLCSKIYEKSLN